MPTNQGTIVLMGSGELTATMVEVHKSLLRKLGESARAVFLDTPAGFQLNADHIAQKAVAYFNSRVQHPLQVASFKSARPNSELAAQRAFSLLRQTDYLLIGPGSPTYALRQWQQSPVAQIMIQRIEAGACMVAASAAALTIGSHTLPVYEIYKVGMPVHWVPGLNILRHFGMHLVVIPHWNNAEGGNHDTRYCFMGAPRLKRLESMLPVPTPILGIDEHTALIIDLASQNATIEGVGHVTVRWQGKEQRFDKGDPLPLSLLRAHFPADTLPAPKMEVQAAEMGRRPDQDDLWEPIHLLAGTAKAALDHGHDEQVATSLLELERHIWQSQEQLEAQNEMEAAREVLREIITLLTSKLASRPVSNDACLAPVVDALLDLRKQFKTQKKWDDADAIRHCLQQADIIVEDRPEGAVWRLDKT
jgi:peptidase E